MPATALAKEGCFPSFVFLFPVTPSSELDTLVSRDRNSAEPRRRLPAWSVPAAIIAGFGILFLLLFGDRLLPAPEVAVTPAIATPAEAGSASDPGQAVGAGRVPQGKVLFQASGWIEPAPLPIKATALIDGVIGKVHVLPGEDVKEGQLLATLIEDDTKLALAAAEQRRLTAESALGAHLAGIEAAERKVDGLEAELAAATARRAEAEDRAIRMERLPAGSVPQADVVSARLNHEREIAQTESAAAAVGQMRSEVARLRAETGVRRGELEAAKVGVGQAGLAQHRTRILSPTDGRILRLLAAPGEKKLFSSDDPDSATVAILYRPRELQVRVDVPLADAAGLGSGVPVRIHCSLLPDKVFRGEVTRIIGEADLRRNTLQAKVSITDPEDRLRPEMLCRVEFLEGGTVQAGGGQAGSADLAVWIPRPALVGDAVWVCDPETRRVAKRGITPSGEVRDDHVRVGGGLRPGEWVVVSPRDLRDGMRVNPMLSP
jgi:HlyD family secretion protein